MSVHVQLNTAVGLKQDPLEKPRAASENPRKRSLEMTVLADGNVMKLQKTRQRKILSCVYCHSKKIKCSRVHPVCYNCKKLGIECKYFVNQRVSRGGRKRSSSSQPDNSDSDSNQGGPENAAADAYARDRSSVSEYSELNGSPPSPPSDEKKGGSPRKGEPVIIGQDGLNFLLPSNHTSPPPKMSLHLGQFPYSPDVNPSPSNLLQAPIVNSLSNNITNNFFNTNYASNNPNPEEQYAFNLSSFTLASDNANGKLSLLNSPLVKPEMDDKKVKFPSSRAMSTLNSSTNLNGMFKGSIQPVTTNFIDGPTPANPVISNISFLTAQGKNNQPNNPGLHNSLNAYSSNPATTVNYLYGTNTYYDNENLLLDLITHLPTSRERSFEILDRYINSVHILLPILVNLSDFVKEHENFWDHFDPYKSSSPSAASSLSSLSPDDFNLLQFYTLYFPVLYASTISEFEEYDNLLLNQDINKYLRGFNKICQYYNYPHGLKTIPILLGNIIIQSTSPNPSTMEMSQIIRYAKLLQLHKDPLISLRITDWKVVKFRRMLWFVIFGLDALSSHNFCLPPVCNVDDFNVVLPDEEDPVFNEEGTMIQKKLNVNVLAMNVKFKFDIILSKLVYQLHNGLSTNITAEEINEIKGMIIQLFHFIHKSINKMNNFYKTNPPTSVQEMNLLNFIKNHSWSFVDRAMMLLHKKILLRDPGNDKSGPNDSQCTSYELTSRKEKNGVLALSQYEDTFGRIQEANIITNFDNSSISQLRFNQTELFTYEDMCNNLIPSILHNLNDFLKYNDFIKFGKFNWYVKRTIPLDSIILLFVIICVKFKYEFMTVNELIIYVKLINKALFILNRKYFKNEKYKRMLSLTNLTWEYILKKYDVIKLINVVQDRNGGSVVFFDYQLTGYMNMSELFNVMDVPQPALISHGINLGGVKVDDNQVIVDQSQKWEAEDSEYESPESIHINQSVFTNQLIQQEKRDDIDIQGQKLEVMQLNEKIYYDLRNNFVDINDYCTFYSSLENLLHELMEYINNNGAPQLQ